MTDSLTRTEKDMLGSMEIPADALYGIHSARAAANFPISLRPVDSGLIRAYGMVKQAAATVNAELGFLPDDKASAIQAACQEMAEGLLNAHIIVDALQGGAGTATNMNVNEVIANRALQILGHPFGSYDIIHPLDNVNLHQSTNDTYPTALRVAAIKGIRELSEAFVKLQEAFQDREKAFADVVRVGRTQLQDAVLTTMGRTMAAFAEAANRDRWRVYKCEERLRVINLGGTAIGTGLGAPRRYIFKAAERLSEITGLGLARSENLQDATQNHDALVEVSGILSAAATNLIKSANDLRLLSSGPEAGLSELVLPALQAGSSIMPGKVNPVIPECVIQTGMLVQGNHTTITSACSAGNLELNSFLPLVADRLLESIGCMTRAVRQYTSLCISKLELPSTAGKGIKSLTAAATALVPLLGYERVTDLLAESRDAGMAIAEWVVKQKILSQEEVDTALSAENVTKLGGD